VVLKRDGLPTVAEIVARGHFKAPTDPNDRRPDAPATYWRWLAAQWAAYKAEKPIKVELERLTVELVPVDLPPTCPECFADLHSPESLRELQFIGAQQDGRIDPDGILNIDGNYEDNAELQYVTGYMCVACGHTIVSAEGT